jgi:ribosomal protein S2
VTIAIPGNDDSEDAVRFYLDVMCNAIIDVKERREGAATAANPVKRGGGGAGGAGGGGGKYSRA